MDCGFESFTADIFTPESEYYYGLALKSRHGNEARIRPIDTNGPATQRTGQRDSPQLPNVTPGLADVLSLSTLNAKVSPARISFTARPSTNA
jgi:hypothetical protein